MVVICHLQYQVILNITLEKIKLEREKINTTLALRGMQVGELPPVLALRASHSSGQSPRLHVSQYTYLVWPLVTTSVLHVSISLFLLL